MTPLRGTFVAIVGPSGAGKDSLLSAARDALGHDQRFCFTRRVITRQSDATEDSESVDQAMFSHMLDRGAFALWWNAHDLRYGLPVSIMEDLAQGRIVIANVSRAVLPTIRSMFSRSCVIQVTASATVLAQRLASRGRETAVMQQGRLARAQAGSMPVDADVTIMNDDDFADASRLFTDALKALLPETISPGVAKPTQSCWL